MKGNFIVAMRAQMSNQNELHQTRGVAMRAAVSRNRKSG